MAALNFPEAIANGQVFEADTGVIYTYIGTPPNGYWSGFAQDTGTDSLNALYVEKNDKGSKQTITGGGGLDLAGNIQLNAINGSAEFDGVVEAGGGVKVTGGTANGVEDGIVRSATTLNFIKSSKARMFIGDDRVAVIGALNTSSTETVGMSVDVTIPEGVNTHSAFKLNAKGNNTSDAVYRGLWFTGQSASGSWSESRGVFIGDDADIGDTNYGIYSALNNPIDKDNYNFYATGSAPNYFKGRIFAGTTSVDNLEASGGINPVLNIFAGASTGIKTVTAASGGGVYRKMFEIFAYDQSNSEVAADATTTGFISSSANNCIFDAGAGGRFESTSDYRIKQNVTPLTSSVAAIKQLNPVSFEFTNSDPNTHLGFIAHELQEIAPRAVSGTKDATEAIGTLADYNGTVLKTGVTEPSAEELTYTEDVTDSEGVTTQEVRTRTWTATGTRPVYQGVDQTKLIPLLTKALQEALERIEVLEAAQA